MKKHITKIASVAALSLPLLVLAQGGITPVVPPTTINLQLIIDRVINWSFGLLLVICVVWIFYAAFLYLTAAGNAEQASTALRYIIYSMIAIVVAFAARGIVVIVRGVIGF